MAKLSDDINALSAQLNPATDPLSQNMKVLFNILSRLATSIENIEENCATKTDLEHSLAATNVKVKENSKKMKT